MCSSPICKSLPCEPLLTGGGVGVVWVGEIKEGVGFTQHVFPAMPGSEPVTMVISMLLAAPLEALPNPTARAPS